jgi:16S rRNA (adenine1518-N6/adenine1519-N6)-dimethyltransferase
MNQSLEHHALINKEVIARLIESAQINDEDLVLEIGAGEGNITKELCVKAKFVVAVEKDAKCTESLKLFKQENLQIIEGDFLDVKIPPWNKLVANPPFNILEPLMYYSSKRIFDCVVLIVGENFANELINDEKTRVSIFSKSYFQIEFVERLSKQDFVPPPKTGTAIIKITPKDKEKLNQKELFFREFFDQRDKTIKNSFIESCTRVLKCTQRQAKEKFTQLKITGDKKVLLVSNEELVKIISSITTHEQLLTTH